jgi:hypothetical protein
MEDGRAVEGVLQVPVLVETLKRSGWIDAVIDLPPMKAEELRAMYVPALTDAEPAVVEGLRDQPPAGPYLGGERLDKALKHGCWWASAYLSEAGELILVATGT